MIPGKMVPGKMVPGKLVPGKMIPGKMIPGTIIPGKMVARKKVPGKLRNDKSWGERRASWCVRGMFGYDQSMKTQNSITNTKPGNKPKTRKQKIVGLVPSIVVCVWNFGM